MNSLYEYIFKRKSVRKYTLTPLSKDMLSQIKAKIESLKPLYPGIKICCEIVDDIKNPMPLKAPHYLLFSSENTDGSFENAGFMLQQMSLYFTSIGLGSCWLGMGKPSEKQQTELQFVIAMSFGYPEEALYREASGFNRKSLNDISEGKDPRLEAARLAPSGMNSQNWFFRCDNGIIHIYRKKVNPLKALIFDKMNSIDTGITLCHLYLASETFSFEKSSSFPERKGLIYMGTVK